MSCFKNWAAYFDTEFFNWPAVLKMWCSLCWKKHVATVKTSIAKEKKMAASHFLLERNGALDQFFCEGSSYLLCWQKVTWTSEIFLYLKPSHESVNLKANCSCSREQWHPWARHISERHPWPFKTRRVESDTLPMSMTE